MRIRLGSILPRLTRNIDWSGHLAAGRGQVVVQAPTPDPERPFPPPEPVARPVVHEHPGNAARTGHCLVWSHMLAEIERDGGPVQPWQPREEPAA